VLAVEKLKICDNCPNNKNWICQKNNKNIINLAKNTYETGPEYLWDIKKKHDDIVFEPGAVWTPTRNSSLQELDYIFKNNYPGSFPGDFHTYPNVQQYFITKFREHIKKDFIYPQERFSGKGILIVGGGPKYFPSVYINVRVIREVLKCELPIQICYLGKEEMDFNMYSLLNNFGNIKITDGRLWEKDHYIRIHAGWESKVYSIMNCDFSELLMIDADCTPLIEPSFLFSEPNYLKYGSILWPDFDNFGPHDEKIGRAHV